MARAATKARGSMPRAAGRAERMAELARVWRAGQRDGERIAWEQAARHCTAAAETLGDGQAGTALREIARRFALRAGVVP